MEEAAEAIAWRKQPKREDLDASWKASWKEKKCTGLVTSAVGIQIPVEEFPTRKIL